MIQKFSLLMYKYFTVSPIKHHLHVYHEYSTGSDSCLHNLIGRSEAIYRYSQEILHTVRDIHYLIP